MKKSSILEIKTHWLLYQAANKAALSKVINQIKKKRIISTSEVI
jgi:hypothetical protein